MPEVSEVLLFMEKEGVLTQPIEENGDRALPTLWVGRGNRALPTLPVGRGDRALPTLPVGRGDRALLTLLVGRGRTDTGE